ncbi:MAG: Mu transposase C-terminal domain-containing protein [Firmicutes bacterium]|nr:Mu transposase C-terminal domain-containing protein [Bacillota bacterium]
MVDFRTRRYVGWAITEHPCQDSTMAAFGMAAMNPEIGIPDSLLLDNGREYTGYSFAGRGHRSRERMEFDEPYVRSLVETLGVAVHFSIPENPTSKGDAERSFRELHESFCKMFETYLGNRPGNRPEDAERAISDRRNLMTIPELFPKLSDFIIHVFNERPHTAPDMEGMSPRQAWEKYAHLRPVKHVDRDVLKMLMMPYAEGRLFTIQKGGIRVWGQRYWSEVLQDHLGESVAVRYDQSDAARVYVFRPDGRFLDAPMIQTPLPFGASSEDLKQAQRIRAKRRRELAAIRRDMGCITSQEILQTRVEAGKLRREQERKKQGQAPTPCRVTEIHPVSQELRQAAKEVAAAQVQATAASREQAPHDGEWDIMAVIRAMPLPGEKPQQHAVGDAHRFLPLLRVLK